MPRNRRLRVTDSGGEAQFAAASVGHKDETTALTCEFSYQSVTNVS
jgi:hypothetical protein